MVTLLRGPPVIQNADGTCADSAGQIVPCDAVSVASTDLPIANPADYQPVKPASSAWVWPVVGATVLVGALAYVALGRAGV